MDLFDDVTGAMKLTVTTCYNFLQCIATVNKVTCLKLEIFSHFSTTSWTKYQFLF